MFDHTQYVPILRWKQAERSALKRLRRDDRGKVTPLIELCPKDFATCIGRSPNATNEALSQKASEISTNWGEASVFVDLIHLDEQMPQLHAANGVHPFVVLAQQIRDRGRPLLPQDGPRLIPVTGLHRSEPYQSAIKAVVSIVQSGACVRLRRRDLADGTRLVRNLQRLADYLLLEPIELDLLVDLQVIDKSAPTILDVCGRVPTLHQWRTFTIASGAFPKNLQGMEEGVHQLPRTDFESWRGQVADAKNLPRRPAFADYTIQHPVYKEPPVQPNCSASIRYTSGDDWVIMRGAGIRNEDGPGAEQWPANALLLRERPEFCGREFSPGDQYIYDMANQNDGNGNPTTWLCAGINHHMTFTARQVAGLFRPPVAVSKGKADESVSR